MEIMFDSIEHHKVKLSNHSFCQLLRTVDGKDKRIFNFVPHMAFFVLSFRDMLERLRVAYPRNYIDESLNDHCDEDSDHWQWFLQDLRTLGLHIHSWGGDIDKALGLIWGPEDVAVRHQVYQIMCHIDRCETTHERLILVECLEAAFAAFVENLNVLTQRMGLYSKLKYFGEHHFNKESDHAMGSWIGETTDKKMMPHQAKYDVREDVMTQMVDDIFAGFDHMFARWESAALEGSKFNVHRFESESVATL